MSLIQIQLSIIFFNNTTIFVIREIRLDIMFIDNKQDIPNLKKRLEKIEVSWFKRRYYLDVKITATEISCMYVIFEQCSPFLLRTRHVA